MNEADWDVWANIEIENRKNRYKSIVYKGNIFNDDREKYFLEHDFSKLEAKNRTIHYNLIDICSRYPMPYPFILNNMNIPKIFKVKGNYIWGYDKVEEIHHLQVFKEIYKLRCSDFEKYIYTGLDYCICFGDNDEYRNDLHLTNDQLTKDLYCQFVQEYDYLKI
jgi:hypothetical protein